MSYLNLETLAYRTGRSKEELLKEMAEELSKSTGQSYESCYRSLSSYLSPGGQEAYNPSQNDYQNAFVTIGAKYDPENYGVKLFQSKVYSGTYGKSSLESKVYSDRSIVSSELPWKRWAKRGLISPTRWIFISIIVLVILLALNSFLKEEEKVLPSSKIFCFTVKKTTNIKGCTFQAGDIIGTDDPVDAGIIIYCTTLKGSGNLVLMPFANTIPKGLGRWVFKPNSNIPMAVCE